ncbi:hypothetical protein [Desulfosporosinus sp. OT]|uniref:hypothetical protein n=1 Tax=Desulfosporosinus sp. OT TaxID=913865 RepID=UPI0002239CC3|nr:hypothetical protein [Desulfosporosinus sp. OT]EGW39542.1 hypothetical protein DOT_2595 [Desulfosporosinus sp. OT]
MIDPNPLKLPNLKFDKYSPLVNRMEKESGDRSNPIWLLINPKYSSVRNDIWAPILEEIQDKVYRKLHTRIDSKKIFIKNTVSDIGIVPNTSNPWVTEVAEADEIVMLRDSIHKHQPKILITFGILTCEYVRRVFDIRPEKEPKYWSTTNLEDEFERSIANFDINQINRIPLPRRVIKSSNFIEDCNLASWEDSENYFRDIGTKIANRIIENKDRLKIWIE